MKKTLFTLPLLILFILSCPTTGPSGTSTGTLSISLTLAAPGSVTNQAVYIWVVDSNNTYVDTINYYIGGITNFTAGNNTPVEWLSDSGVNSDGSEHPNIDGTTGATTTAPATYTSATWDCKNASGTAITEGTYKIRVNVEKDSGSAPATYAEGTITIGSSNDAGTITTGTDTFLTAGTITYTAP